MSARPAAPAALRAVVAADLAPVAPLASPLRRAAAMVPLALLLLVAAPLAFERRIDLPRLGWGLGWGVSAAEIALGLALAAAAFREAVPGREWSRPALAAWLALPAAAVIAATLASFHASPVAIRAGWWAIGGLCLAGAIAGALPAVVLGSVLAARAWPTRPAAAGLLAGLGAGVMSDAGWRLFCGFSEPGHVLTAHAASILAAGLIGAWLTPRLTRGHAAHGSSRT